MADVAMGSIPVLNFIAQKSQTDAETQQNQNLAQRQMDAANFATSNDISAIGNAANAQEIITSARNSAVLNTESENAKSRTLLGADPNAANFRLADLTAQKDYAYDQTNALAKTIADKKSISVLNDPLGFIHAQFTLPADIAQHNYYAEVHNNAASEYDGIVSSATQTAQENKAHEATVTAASAQADNQQIADVAQQNIAKVQRENVRLNLQGVQILQGLNENTLNNAATAVSVANQAQEIEMKKAQFPLIMAQKNLYMGYLQDRMEQRQLTLADQKSAQAYYNVGSDALGGSGNVPAATVMSKLKSKSPIDSAIFAYGQRIVDNHGSAEGVPIGENAAQTGALLRSAPGLIPTGTKAGTMQWLAKSTDALFGNPEVQAEKDVGAKSNLVNEGLLNAAKTQASKIDDRTPGNIYAAPSIATVTSATPDLTKNGFINNVLLPKAAANPDMPSSSADVMAAGVATLKSDPSQLNEVAAGITQFYNASIRYNNTMKGYAETGLPLQPAKYPAAVPNQFLGGSHIVDMTDLTSVKTQLMKQSLLSNPKLRGMGVLTTGPN